MAFTQLTYRKSLRDIETCLLANQMRLYGMGFRSTVKRSTLADANEGRDWRIWADTVSPVFFKHLISTIVPAQSMAISLQPNT
jgi:hypothetical protein